MQTYTVTKTVEYIFTIEAENADQAERTASLLTSDEADQWTILELSAESDTEYEASMKE